MSSINYQEAHSWNRCPACGKPVPPNEWVSYLRCEDCWAEHPYNPPHAGPTITTRTDNAPVAKKRGGRQ